MIEKPLPYTVEKPYPSKTLNLKFEKESLKFLFIVEVERPFPIEIIRKFHVPVPKPFPIHQIIYKHINEDDPPPKNTKYHYQKLSSRKGGKHSTFIDKNHARGGGGGGKSMQKMSEKETRLRKNLQYSHRSPASSSH